MDLDGDGRGAPEEINQALDQAARGNHIVANGWGPGSDGVRGIPTFKDPVAFTSTMEGNPDTAYVTAAAPVGQVSLAVGTSKASNGIVAAAVKDDSGTEGDDGYTCAPTGTSSCIGVNMARGSWRGPAIDRTPATASWAAAKLAGYAALLREAFAPANGEQLVGIILDGANKHNVFQLDRALERAGLPAIGNGRRYANAREPDTGGGATADTAFTGWTAAALAGLGAAVPVARAAEPGGLGLAAFATPDMGVDGGAASPASSPDSEVSPRASSSRTAASSGGPPPPAPTPAFAAPQRGRAW